MMKPTIGMLLVPTLMIWFALGPEVSAEEKSYQPYPFDAAPFHKHRDIGRPWEELDAEWKDKDPPAEVFQRRAELIEALSAREPDWIDGYWMAAQWNFHFCEQFRKDEDIPRARSICVRGKEYAEACLKRQEQNPLCRGYYIANLLKIAGIDGILASLSKAKLAEDYMLSIVDSPYNFEVLPHKTLQGTIRLGLAVFYRALPDSIFLQWFFGVRGQITKAIQYHRENLRLDTPSVCSRLLYAAALICQSRQDQQSEPWRQGQEQLRLGKQLPIQSIGDGNCRQEIQLLENRPQIACAFGLSRPEEYEHETRKVNAY